MLKGKWALVTGATAGLGLAVAESLAGAGANIVLHDLAEPRETARSAAIPFRRRGDQRCRGSVAAPFHRSHDGRPARPRGAIDILVNNAVVRHFAPVEEFAPERWDEALAVNLSAPFHLIRLALPAMKQRGWGRIINMASIYSTRAVADRIDYVTTKTAILGMTRAVAIETATSGITCNAISRARCRRRRSRERSHRWLQAKAAPSTRRRATIWRRASRAGGSSPWKASAQWSSSCASPAGQDITGATLPIDGGWAAA